MVKIEPGKYRVIYADPAWHYNDVRNGSVTMPSTILWRIQLEPVRPLDNLNFA